MIYEALSGHFYGEQENVGLACRSTFPVELVKGVYQVTEALPL